MLRQPSSPRPRIASRGVNQIPSPCRRVICSTGNDQLISQLNQDREARLRMQAELQIANNQIHVLSQECAELRSSASIGAHGIDSTQLPHRTAYVASSKLLSRLVKSNLPISDIVIGVLSALSSCSCMIKEINNFIMSNESTFSVASNYFHDKMYQELRHKFRPWVCLQQLDLAATVSFRAYDIIRSVEFADEEDKKYRRGFLYS